MKLHVNELYLPLRNSICAMKLKKNINNKIGFFSKFFYYVGLLVTTVFFLKNIRKIDVLYISDSGSRALFDGVYVDQLMDIVADKDTNQTSLLFEIPTIGSSYTKFNSYKSCRIISGGVIYFLQLCFSFFLKEKDVEIYVKSLKEINEFSNMPLAFIRNVVKTYIARKKATSFILNIIAPQKIVLKSSYSISCMCFLSLAKELDIQSEEIQHSHIYPEHYGYFFNDTEYLFFKKYFRPNVFRGFNQYYIDLLAKSGWLCSADILGNLYYKTYRNFSTTSELSDFYDILIISQHNLYKEISDWLTVFIKTHNECNICIKCHPRGISEYLYYVDTFKNMSNIKIIKNKSIFEVFDVSKSVVGVYSSGLIDALDVNLDVYVLQQIDGSSKMKDFLELGVMKNITEYRM